MKRRLGILLTIVLLAGMVLISPAARGAEASGEARMLSFTLAGCEGKISESSGAITVTMNAQADLGGLIARFTASANARVYVGGVQQSSGTTANDFSQPVKYTVVSQDEKTKKTYTVRVTVKSGSSELLSFKVGGASGKIDQTNRTVSVSIGGNVGSLAPEFKVSSGATLRLGSSGGPVVTSKETKVNFASAVDLYVVAANGSFTKYTVTVKSTKADLRFTKFTLGGYEGVIDASSRVITVNLPAGAGRSNLVATFATSPDCRVCVGGRKGTPQKSGSTANDFNASVKYYLVDEKNDENYVVYTVNVVASKTSARNDEVSTPKDAKVVSVMPARLELGKRYAWRPSVSGTLVSVSNRSSNTSVVAVDADGGYDARKEGTATLTTVINYRNSGGKTRSKTVTQKVKVVIPVSAVELSASKLTVSVGGSAALTAKVSPSSATDPEVTWSTSNSAVARVDASGKVTGVKRGSCTITCASADGVKATCRVTVE